MKFITINNNDDIESFMIEFNRFHDSCIKEIKYVSSSNVDAKRAMRPFDDDNYLIIVFQSQIAKNGVIELRFDKLGRLNLKPREEGYDSIIFEASLIKHNDLYYWSEWANFDPDENNDSIGTWVSAKKISWRALDEKFMGEGDIFAELS